MTLYGLPETVKFCSRCTMSNQRPNSCLEFEHTAESIKPTIHFDDEGICDACRVAERKKNIDWEDRRFNLTQLLDKHRKHNGQYDCIIPGSGGKDSFYAAWMLKYEFGMHPLTVTWRPHLYTDWGWRNHTRWIDAGFDNILFSPNGKTHRLLTRLAVENLLHPFQPFILGQKQLAPRMAALYNIPLVFYGENEAEYGNPIADTSTSERDWKYYTAETHDDIHLGGASIADIIHKHNVDLTDLEPYFPANPSLLKEKQIEVHYLGYYLKWVPQECYYFAHEHGGFETSDVRQPGTYGKYNSIDDKIDDFHYYTTWIKYGIGRATYDSSQEIRNSHIDRDEGIGLVKKFDGEYPQRFEKDIFEYLSVPGFKPMNREYFDRLCDKFRSPHLWDGRKLRHTIYG